MGPVDIGSRGFAVKGYEGVTDSNVPVGIFACVRKAKSDNSKKQNQIIVKKLLTIEKDNDIIILA